MASSEFQLSYYFADYFIKYGKTLGGVGVWAKHFKAKYCEGTRRPNFVIRSGYKFMAGFLMKCNEANWFFAMKIVSHRGEEKLPN